MKRGATDGEFRRKIKKLRKEKTHSKTTGRFSDVAISVISAYESGNRYPSYEVLINLSHIFMYQLTIYLELVL